MSNNAHDLSNRLLNALDNSYNVVDMHTVNEIISILEKINITKELLETTRLGKHVNELRRKTTDPTLARRAKVLVKRWRDLVIPSRSSPGHTSSNRNSGERQVPRLGGTPLTSPALSRVVSPAVPSPRPPSRPAWGGYESDSNDVILVDDEPPPAPLPAAPVATTSAPGPPSTSGWKPLTPVKRPPEPDPVHEGKKSKRDKKPKKRRGHSRAGTGNETTTPAPPVVAPSIASPSVPPASSTPPAPPAPHAPPSTPAGWHARNGSHERRKNGCRKEAMDKYTALVNSLPTAGTKKNKTTQELLEQIQSRGTKPAPSSDHEDDDVVVVEDDEDYREYADCTCDEEMADENCPAAVKSEVLPFHIRALHNAYLPGVNGTRAPTHPHQFAVRKLTDPEKPDLFTSVVPLYKYSDYADDYCVKNMSRVPLPYPIDLPEIKEEIEDSEIKIETTVKSDYKCVIEPEIMSLPNLEQSERLKAPLLLTEDVKNFDNSVVPTPMEVSEDFKLEQRDHRTVERTKFDIDGKTLYEMCENAIESVPYDYSQTASAPVVTLPQDDEAPSVLESALEAVAADRQVDELGRPPRPDNFTEWHECAKLGDLIALPYVVID
ncbi:TFIIS helical bundle-like domain-containing protein [Phthorimaea operculella]|nr:TFIIS helical bundle-like domain-containing protein [Phthorimaea operculella]